MARTESRMTTEAVTKAEFWDAIVEDGANSSAILPWLGNLVTEHANQEIPSDLGAGSGMPSSSSSGSINAIQDLSRSRQQLHSSGLAPGAGNPARFESLLRELVETERSYVRRIDALYNRYAQPLRQHARHRQTAIIPLYEAQRLFGNIGELLGANMAFLQDLESAAQSTNDMSQLKHSIGEIAHRHMACFGCYNEYFNNFEKAKHIEQTMSKTNKLFRDFVEGVKQTSLNLGNVSIRELIMEPVQRIPRYKLLLDGIIKSLPPQYSAQRARLDEAVVLCSRIASCEVDEKTQRAAVLWSFGRNVHGFPVSRKEHKYKRDSFTDSFDRLLPNRLVYSQSIDNSSTPSTWTTSH